MMRNSPPARTVAAAIAMTALIPLTSCSATAPMNPEDVNLTWLRLVSSCCLLDGGECVAGWRVERGAGVEDVVAGLDGDAAVAA